MDYALARMIGTAARLARERHGLTQAEVAQSLPMHHLVYGRLERGEMLPSVSTLWKLRAYLGVPADMLLGLRDLDPSVFLSPLLGSPADSERPEIRRLIRKVHGLNRRKVRLLLLLAATLSKTSTK
jgi:transcriptional regulator with XRE-family HTH domain